MLSIRRNTAHIGELLQWPGKLIPLWKGKAKNQEKLLHTCKEAYHVHATVQRNIEGNIDADTKNKCRRPEENSGRKYVIHLGNQVGNIDIIFLEFFHRSFIQRLIILKKTSIMHMLKDLKLHLMLSHRNT
ncbi:hypothetical protein CEXT_254341 [Caerostris extrusa]|uniref:Uncharacterized protein n=1 Tax=Caerostris extrusa TaxID=172846 RepID=A0AAV4SA24_CAEEX|nr:hypothetical protein CEXT_254341 [Caerostris extrusa]